MRRPPRGSNADDQDVVILRPQGAQNDPDPRPSGGAPVAPGVAGDVGWDLGSASPAALAFANADTKADDLHRWLRYAVVGTWAGKPSVGLIRWDNTSFLTQHVQGEMAALTYNGHSLHVFNKFGGQKPLYLLELKTVWKAAEVARHDDFIQAAAQDIIQPADVLRMELNLRPILLFACIDIRDTLTEAEVRLAKAVVRSSLNEGCSALLTYSDLSSYQELDRRGFFDFGEIPVRSING